MLRLIFFFHNNLTHHELLSCCDRSKEEFQQEPETSNGLVVVSNDGDEILPSVLTKAVVGEKTVIILLGLDSMSQKHLLKIRLLIQESYSSRLRGKASHEKWDLSKFSYCHCMENTKGSRLEHSRNKVRFVLV